MKNFAKLLVIAIALTFAFSSCKKNNCEDAVTALNAAATAYTAEQSAGNCSSYKAALEAAIKDCDTGGAGYQALIDGLGC